MLGLGLMAPFVAVLLTNHFAGIELAGFAFVVSLVVYIICELALKHCLKKRPTAAKVFSLIGNICFSILVMVIGNALIFILAVFLRRTVLKHLAKSVRAISGILEIAGFIYLEKKLINIISRNWKKLMYS